MSEGGLTPKQQDSDKAVGEVSKQAKPFSGGLLGALRDSVQSGSAFQGEHDLESLYERKPDSAVPAVASSPPENAPSVKFDASTFDDFVSRPAPAARQSSAAVVPPPQAPAEASAKAPAPPVPPSAPAVVAPEPAAGGVDGAKEEVRKEPGSKVVDFPGGRKPEGASGVAAETASGSPGATTGVESGLPDKDKGSPDTMLAPNLPIGAAEIDPMSEKERELKQLALLEPKIGAQKVEVIKNLGPEERSQVIKEFTKRFLNDELDLKEDQHQRGVQHQYPASLASHMFHSLFGPRPEKKSLNGNASQTKPPVPPQMTEAAHAQVMPAGQFHTLGERDLIESLGSYFKEADYRLANIERDADISALIQKKAEHDKKKPTGRADPEWGATAKQLDHDLKEALNVNPMVRDQLFAASEDMNKMAHALKEMERRGLTHGEGDNIPKSEEIKNLSRRMDDMSAGLDEEERTELKKQMEAIQKAIAGLFERFRQRFGMSQGAQQGAPNQGKV